MVQRHFGGAYKVESSTNSIVEVRRMDEGSRGSVAKLRWKFGTHMSVEGNDLRFAYDTSLIPDAKGTGISFQFQGTPCFGHFYPSAGVCSLHVILADGVSTVTYRTMDANTMAVTIVEAREKAMPSIQYGHMFRLREALYLFPVLTDDGEDVEGDEEGHEVVGGEGGGEVEGGK